MQDAGVYRITVLRGSKVPKYYIGQSHNLRTRLAGHLRDLRLGRHWNKELQADYCCYGADAISFDVVAICKRDKIILAAYEQEVVDSYPKQRLYNIRTQCVITGLGTKASVERRAKIAAAITGLKRSAETRAKIGAAQAWKKTPEGRAKMSASHSGWIASDETRAKMSASRMGRVVSEETKAKRRETRRKKTELYGSVYSDAARAALIARNKLRSGIPVSAETRAKISAAGIGRKRSPETCAKISAGNMGRKVSPESVAKIRAANIGRKHTPEAKKNMGNSHRGSKRSDETRAKMREARSRQAPITEETRMKMRLAAQNRAPITEETRKRMSVSRLAYYSMVTP